MIMGTSPQYQPVDEHLPNFNPAYVEHGPSRWVNNQSPEGNRVSLDIPTPLDSDLISKPRDRVNRGHHVRPIIPRRSALSSAPGFAYRLNFTAGDLFARKGPVEFVME